MYLDKIKKIKKVKKTKSKSKSKTNRKYKQKSKKLGGTYTGSDLSYETPTDEEQILDGFLHDIYKDEIMKYIPETRTAIDVHYKINRGNLKSLVRRDLGAYIDFDTPRQFPFPKNLNYVDKLYYIYCQIAQNTILNNENHDMMTSDLTDIVISFILADDFMKIFAEVLRKYHFRKTLNVIIQGILNLLKDGYIKFHDPDYKFNDSQSLALNRKNMLISICKKHGIEYNRYRSRAAMVIKKNQN
tara:strand:- start:3295 stop:4023 length:729 start_codon:yes stop_codon:yes gene_type:complete